MSNGSFGETVETHSYPSHLLPKCSTCNNGKIYFPFQVYVFYQEPGAHARSLHTTHNFYVVDDEHPAPLLYIGLSPDGVGKAVYDGTVLLYELEGNMLEDWSYKIVLHYPARVPPPPGYVKL